MLKNRGYKAEASMLEAEVSSSSSRCLPVPISRTRENAVDVHYDLSE
jgi:hypothetical protein